MLLLNMPKALPKWISVAYSKLFKEFKENSFSIEDAKKILISNTNVIIHHLKEAGWIEFVGFDEDDDRKRFYKLKKLEEIFTSLENGRTKQISQGKCKTGKGKRS